MGGNGMVTARQVDWIFDRSRDFMKRWVEKPPSNEGEWRQLMGEAHDLMKRGRNHPLLMGVMLGLLNYLGGEAELVGGCTDVTVGKDDGQS